MGTADTAVFYWIWQFICVMFGYLFLMFLWPMVVFHRHLRGKGKVYRFGFCVAVQPVVISTLVLTLGLLHILNRWTTCAFLVLPFLFFGFRALWPNAAKLQHDLDEWDLLGLKPLPDQLKSMAKTLWRVLRPHAWEYLALAFLVIHALVYFSYGAVQYPSYGSGDQYVHHSWVQGMIEGRVFADGIYPAGMHCVLYSIHTLFRLPVYSCILFLGSIHTSVILLSAYCLLRELFGWRFAPAFALALYLFYDFPMQESGIARLQWALPQEFGMAAQFISALFLLRYLKGRQEQGEQQKKYCVNKELFLFLMAVAATITFHFYATLMAFFLCLGVALPYLKRIFTRERLLPLCAAVLCGVLIAAAPMLAARAEGIPFQGSIDWAFNVIQGDVNTDEVDIGGPGQQQDKGISAYVDGVQRGYRALYGEDQGAWMINITAAVLLIATVLWLVLPQLPPKLREWIVKRRIERQCLEGWLPLALVSLVLMVVYTVPFLGLPKLIAGSRLYTTETVLLMALLMIPLDLLFFLAKDFCKEDILHPVSILCIAGICGVTVGTGNYRGFLYSQLTRYNAEVMVTNSIVESFPSKSYTIVAPTDVLYHVVEDGWHEELVTFAAKTEEDDYTLPSEYVFIYVEKKPIQYAQQLYFDGPAGLAVNRHPDKTKIRTSEISLEAARKEPAVLDEPFDSYRDLENRTIIESKVYYWCRQFARSYPREMKVYYEDESFVCYYFRQEPSSPYNLGSLYNMPKVKLKTEQFTESAQYLQNPNRGFYRIYQHMITDQPQDYPAIVAEQYAEATEDTLALVEVNLQQYRTGEITPAGMANLRSLFDALRQGGKQLIVRFLYDWQGLNLQREPQRLEIILGHMEQVGEVLRENHDIIYTTQGLFVGDWGELHNTRYTATEDLKQLAQKMAQVTEDSTYLAVRTPAQWRNVTGRENAGEPAGIGARLGLFNDAILSSSTDLGTYTGDEEAREAELAFQQQLCAYVPNGGEVITNNPYNDFENAARDLARMRISYLNRDYDKAVLEKWAGVTVSEGSCFDGIDGLSYLERHLGYRLVLDQVRFQRDFFQDSIRAEVALRNVGFAPLYREPEAVLRLVGATGRTLEFPLSGELRELKGGSDKGRRQVLTAEVPVTHLPKGRYSVYLTITDPDSGSAILLGNEQQPDQNGYLLGSIERR